MTENLKQITGLLINPLTRRLEQVTFGEGLESIYKLLSCTHVDVVRMANGDAIYVDDNGLFTKNGDLCNDEGELAAFSISGVTSSAIAGFGLVVGCDDLDGADDNCKSTTLDFVGKLSFGLIPVEGTQVG